MKDNDIKFLSQMYKMVYKKYLILAETFVNDVFFITKDFDQIIALKIGI